MLARTFLTAKQLGISEVDRQAALKLLDMLERVARDTANPRMYFYNYRLRGYEVEHGGLNMAHWGSQDPATKEFCGCIGGWMERMKGRVLSDRTMNAWDDLFEPVGFDPFSIFFKRYTPERCARALYTKLTTGIANWS